MGDQVYKTNKNWPPVINLVQVKHFTYHVKGEILYIIILMIDFMIHVEVSFEISFNLRIYNVNKFYYLVDECVNILYSISDYKIIDA